MIPVTFFYSDFWFGNNYNFFEFINHQGTNIKGSPIDRNLGKKSFLRIHLRSIEPKSIEHIKKVKFY